MPQKDGDARWESLNPPYVLYRLAPESVIRVSEELAAKSTRDEIIWSLYTGLASHLGYFISLDYDIENDSSDTHSRVLN